MNYAYLLIGGNLGDRINNLERSKDLIQAKAGNILKCSSVYETAPWGNSEQPLFLNQALLIETYLTPEALLKAALSFECMMGRVRNEKLGPRIIDIDILFYNEDLIETANLIIPHPNISERKFVLKPLCEIAPKFIHPIFRKNISTLLKECTDKLAVKTYTIA